MIIKNMSKFSIQELTEKEGKTGNKYHLATLREESEEGIESKVSSFDLIGKKVGDIVEGEIVQNGQYLNFKIKKEYVAKTGGASAGVKVAQERKQEMISKTMDRKELSILLAGSSRDATLITVAQISKMPFPTDDEIKAKWIMWRNWVMKQGDIDETTPF
jgi:hypothetical protein